MYVESLALKDFRNYENLDIALSPGINVLCGDNAQGKTNVLEALYMCATSRSHRGSRDHEMIRFGCDQSHIRGIISRDEMRHRIDIHLKRGSAKGIAIDSRSIRRSGELFGLVNMVCFSPEDLSMIKNGPSQRRHFLDMELCQLSRVYIHDISSYNRTVNQRNALLKQISYDKSLEDTLDIWDMQLVRYGSGVISQRKEFIDLIGMIASSVHESLTAGREELKIIYRPSCKPEEFEELLRQRRDTDLRYRTTGTGPHRDDFIFQVNGSDVRKYGSQGQQRTAALSLKLAEIELVKKKTGDTPVLLLDDVLSELDSLRQKDLLGSIKDVQAVITCTEVNDFLKNNTKIDRLYRVTGGRIS